MIPVNRDLLERCLAAVGTLAEWSDMEKTREYFAALKAELQDALAQE